MRLELNDERQKSCHAHVPTAAGRNQCDPRNRGRIGLAVQRVIDMESIRGRRPAAIDQHRCAGRQPQGRDQGDARRPLEAAPDPGPLGREVVDAVRDDAPLPDTVRGSSALQLERRQRQTRSQRDIAGPTLREPIQLPDTESHAPRGYEHRPNYRHYVAALHKAIFWARGRRLIAASRFNALARSAATSW